MKFGIVGMSTQDEKPQWIGRHISELGFRISDINKASRGWAPIR
jgi:hypothetical protein